jgi:hypothetical protein
VDIHFCVFICAQGHLVALDKTSDKIAKITSSAGVMGLTCVEAYAFDARKSVSDQAGESVHYVLQWKYIKPILMVTCLEQSSVLCGQYAFGPLSYTTTFFGPLSDSFKTDLNVLA